VTDPNTSPASGGNRAGRQLDSNDTLRRRYQARRQRLADHFARHQQQASLAQLQADQSDALRSRVSDHLQRQGHYATTAQLIDLLIERYPSCPKFASLLVDRLMAGDEALADALRSEGV